ncbi:DNA cytosine methyltransferase [Pseudogulbenkiania ferrooxidans]|uniref:DNA (cytosine-5-)-methyltransferase n=1 Tax=Pseudogulbenkiania ferrooxidans 2002 TaxID=279714 RepID=B9YYR5_9NEIS|nr:DNA cytosine methyltransferase [Pseudogulbenkiania ferrooxidans]EEG10268.1 C-5 cytosine-specific DNA methylase [Pseudogulbenkiania ferrooxidans 2002]
MVREQFSLLTTDEIIVDLFAGGGGKSTGIEHALGRHVDIAINHDSDAISMHEANHPQTEHYCADVFEVCPRTATRGRPVGHLHGSPDCTHFSQAIGGQPRDKKIRGLGWVIPRWAGQVHPRSISMENVKQMQQWGPLIAKRCKQTGRVMKLDGTVAAPGERVPVQQQFLVPDPKHVGRTWRRFVSVLEQLGYQVEYRLMNAADYGAATTRERLFLFARRDGRPIVWPEPTHFKQPKKGQKAWRAAADHIDFSNLGESIFTRKKPLADATLRRIAKGMHKYVLNTPKPFIVELANWSNRNGVHDIEQPLNTITAHPKGGSFAVAQPSLVPLTHQGGDRVHDSMEPVRTITAANRGEIAVAMPVLVQAAHGEGKPGRAQRWGDGSKPATGPVNTITASGCGGQALATAYLMQANGGFNQTVGRSLDEPATTITTTGSQQQLVAAHLVTLRRNCFGREFNAPMAAITAGAEHHAVASYMLSKENEDAALRCASFLISYYGTDNVSGVDQPMPTATTRDRLALVTVWVKGEPYVIVDICLRMLTPRELYLCQGFPASYIIDRGHDGRPFTKTAQVRMVGNSVSPGPAQALIEANCMDLAAWSHKELKQRQLQAA